MTTPRRLYYKIFRCARRSRWTELGRRRRAVLLPRWAVVGRARPLASLGAVFGASRDSLGPCGGLLGCFFPCSKDPARLVAQACPAVLAGSRACQLARTRAPVCPRSWPRERGALQKIWRFCCALPAACGRHAAFSMASSISGACCKACLVLHAMAMMREEIQQTCLGPLVSGALRLSELIAA